MEISAKVVMDLRAKTGVSMMACKKALVESGGDEEKAIEYLRKSGEAKALSKADRDTHEGAVAVAISADKKKGAIVSLLCETDFVARNEDFVHIVNTVAETALAQGVDAAKAAAEAPIREAVLKLGENIRLDRVDVMEGELIGSYVHSNKKVGGLVVLIGGANDDMAKDIAMQVVAASPDAINPEQIDSSLVEKEKDIYADQLRTEGKPAEMIEKILIGKMNKFKEERALMTQAFIKDPAMKVRDMLKGAGVVQFSRVAI